MVKANKINNLAGMAAAPKEIAKPRLLKVVSSWTEALAIRTSS